MQKKNDLIQKKKSDKIKVKGGIKMNYYQSEVKYRIIDGEPIIYNNKNIDTKINIIK